MDTAINNQSVVVKMQIALLLVDGGFDEWEMLDNARKENPAAFELFEKYHCSDAINECKKLICVKSDFFPVDALITMQQNVQRLINEREIALEVLTTSNVRISFYKSHDEHHILRWLLPESGDHKMQVVLGTDDPGIFATNMRNELEHIMRELKSACNMDNAKAETLISELLKNGERFRFYPISKYDTLPSKECL